MNVFFTSQPILTKVLFTMAMLLLAPLSQAERSDAEIKQLVRAYLLENPEVILEAVNLLREREAAAEQTQISENLSRLQNQLIGNEADPVGGSVEGDVILVEFFDYNCSFCKRVNPMMKALIEQNPDLKVVYKEFPILSETSVTAARVALAVNSLYPEEYEAFHRALLEHNGNLRTDDDVWQILNRFGMDVVRIRSESQQDWISQTINENRQLASALGITGTPSFVIGEQILKGALPQADIQAAIDQLR